MSRPGEHQVRMGEYAASRRPGDVLVAIGLGSCIGLALVDRGRGLAGLAHIMLPASAAAAPAELGKFADRAVPALVERLLGLGALRPRLEASLVGGAQMFALGPRGGGGLDVGRRNEAAVREALRAARVAVAAAATGGSKGRTVRVRVDGGLVSVKEAGGSEVELGRTGRPMRSPTAC